MIRVFQSNESNSFVPTSSEGYGSAAEMKERLLRFCVVLVLLVFLIRPSLLHLQELEGISGGVTQKRTTQGRPRDKSVP